MVVSPPVPEFALQRSQSLKIEVHLGGARLREQSIPIHLFRVRENDAAGRGSLCGTGQFPTNTEGVAAIRLFGGRYAFSVSSLVVGPSDVASWPRIEMPREKGLEPFRLDMKFHH